LQGVARYEAAIWTSHDVRLRLVFGTAVFWKLLMDDTPDVRGMNPERSPAPLNVSDRPCLDRFGAHESEDRLGTSDDLGGDPAFGVKKHRHRRTVGSKG
jgi:hypothetical protein